GPPEFCAIRPPRPYTYCRPARHKQHRLRLPGSDHDCSRVLTALGGMLLRVAVSRQTLCYVFRSGEGGRRQVLLGRKKRGFGAGMIMGLGGKAGPGESEAACAVREAGEEAGIAVDPGTLEWRGGGSAGFRASA